MVWGLLPVDPTPSSSSSGEEGDKYYIFRKGTYVVGRKGCDIIIHNDKGVSRIHAHLIVDQMTQSSQLGIKDLSKYGTFVNKNLTSNRKVHEFFNKLLFKMGTCFLLVLGMRPTGACLTLAFSEECTHVLVDQHMPLKRDVLDAIVALKPVLHCSWLELVADKSIRVKFPDCRSHVPTIMVDGVSIEVSDPKTRENCLGGYTFLLESTYMYKFGDQLQLLLEVSGSRTIRVEDISASSQAFGCGENICLTYVIPGRSVDKFDHLDKLGLSYRVNEMALIRAVLSGNLDQSILIPSSVLVSSSCSTDETVVADSDEENEVATPVNKNAATHKEGARIYVNGAEISMEAPNNVSKAEVSTYHDATRLEDGQVTFKDDNYCLTARSNKVDESEYGSSNIVYSQVLIVRDVNITSTSTFITDNGVINYKRFRKASIQSGNSFNNLVPFSKYPYKDYEFGSGEIAESVKEEKKRKKMEAIAEDMFNNEKGRQRGSRRALHTRG
ncbi:hypothetical protein REPUB_Repub12eG0001300 [Reevesia pubescens]